MKKLETVFPWVLGVSALAAAAISLVIGLRQSVWFDEAYSILLAEHSWAEIVRLTAADVHPPLYYWLLKAWMLLFGNGELALRSMSVLFLGLSVVAAGVLLRKLFGVKTALLALPFIVFAPFLLRYGFEIRMYALCSFIGVAATYALVSAVDETRKKQRWLLFAAYALLVALGVYTLYFMALVWIAHVVWLARMVRKEHRYDLIKPALLAYGGAFVLFIPWLPIFLGKAGGGTLSAVTHSLGLENLYGILTFLFFYQPSWNWDRDIVTVVGAFSALGLAACLAWLAYKNAKGDERRSLLLLAAYFLVPVAVLVVVTHIQPVYLERYLAHYAIGAYMGVGVVAALALQRAGVVAKLGAGVLFAMLLIGCVSLARYGNYNFQRVHTPSVKQIAAELGACRDGAIIFADGPQVAMEIDYYITDCPVYFFNETLEMGGGFAMYSGSPLRVADASELPEADELLHVYYDKPKRQVPSAFEADKTVRVGALSVTAYLKK